MNTLLLDQYSDPGGAQQVLLELLPAIRERGWHAVVGLPGNGKLFDTVRAMGVEVVRIDCPRAVGTIQFLSKTMQLATQIRQLAEQTEAELVYLNGPRLVPAAALAGLNCPVLFHSHSFLPAGAARTITGLSLRRLDARVVANCRFVAEQWRKFVRPERICVIINGVDGPTRTLPRRPDGPARIACIGRVSPEKGQCEFVKVAAKIHETLPECRFAIYGDAMFSKSAAQRYYEKVRAAAAGLPIEFHGWVNGIYDALAEIDLLLVPSVGPEATTRVIPEAFAAGVPVIAFDTGGISEVIENGVTGALTRSVEEMARESISLLAGDPQRRISMAQAAHASWEQRFTSERFHQLLLAAMEDWAASRQYLRATPPAPVARQRRS
jgi:glycosyltransferase involved in cell wall biosynthesis